MNQMTRIELATVNDTNEILALYHDMIGGAAQWNEDYPNVETIQFDLSRDALFVMKNEKNEVIAAISIDEDETVNSLNCWNKDLQPSAELARLCVRKDYQNRGIARQMMMHVFGVLKENGMKSVHIFVVEGHEVALRSYAHLNYQVVGSCELFERQFICLEKAL